MKFRPQLKALFKDTWETIPGNCDTFIYLGGNEKSTHKYVSELLGKGTIDKKSSGETKGRHILMRTLLVSTEIDERIAVAGNCLPGDVYKRQACANSMTFFARMMTPTAPMTAMISVFKLDVYKRQDDFCSLLSTIRSREISSIIIIQNFAQLKALFKDTWETIPGNCDTFIYLGGNEQSTHCLLYTSL